MWFLMFFFLSIIRTELVNLFLKKERKEEKNNFLNYPVICGLARDNDVFRCRRLYVFEIHYMVNNIELFET